MSWTLQSGYLSLKSRPELGIAEGISLGRSMGDNEGSSDGLIEGWSLDNDEGMSLG